MRLIVTGASGQFGRMVTERLLERVSASDLILVTRNPSTLAHLKARGAEVRAGDFDKPESLPAAFAGGERMLLISTLSVGRRAEQHLRALNAALAAGVRYIAYTSSGGMNPHNPALIVPDHMRTEAALKASGVAFTILRDSLYIEAPLHQIAPRALAVGKWISSSGEGRVGFVAKADCVAVAATVLTGNGHEGKTYEITGPELLSFREVAAIAAQVDGRPVQYVDVSDEAMAAMLAAAGVPKHYMDGMHTPGVGTSSIADIVSYERGIRGGFFAIRSDDVAGILGRAPVSLGELFRANKSALRPPAGTGADFL
ncbi:MAG: SDR family oxidoreductase [Gammaproteobacteria bacterium]